jgi:regulator of sigma D
MLENCQSAKERWGGVNDIIDRWLQERQDLLVTYCSLSEQLESDDACQKVQKLCQILVDYVSAGHFEVYDQLIKEGREFNDEAALKEANELFSKIDITTEFALDFNDKYQETDDLETISADSSKLGEMLESRFETEDRMIEVLHVSHRDMVV